MRKLLITVLLLFAGGAMADQRAHDAALRLFDAIDMTRVMEQTIDQALALETQKNPAMLPYREVFRKFLSKYLSFDAVKDDMAAMYLESFSADELDQLADFYRTDLGRKTLDAMPVLMRKGGQLGMERVKAHLPELRTMIEAEAHRLKSMQQP